MQESRRDTAFACQCKRERTISHVVSVNMGKHLFLLVLVMITGAQSRVRALVVQQVVEATCNPDVAVIHINASVSTVITTIVVRNPGGQTVGQAYISGNVTWKARPAYTDRTSFISVNSLKKVYIFQLNGITFMDTGLYTVDVKHGGNGNTDIDVFIGIFKEKELQPTVYYDDHIIRNNSHLTVTHNAPLVLHTGRGLRADISITVYQIPVERHNTTQGTINITQDLEAGPHKLNIFYNIQYREQCSNVTGNISLSVTVRKASSSDFACKGWMIPMWVLVATVLTLVISIGVLLWKYKQIKRDAKVEHHPEPDPHIIEDVATTGSSVVDDDKSRKESDAPEETDDNQPVNVRNIIQAIEGRCGKENTDPLPRRPSTKAAGECTTHHSTPSSPVSFPRAHNIIDTDNLEHANVIRASGNSVGHKNETERGEFVQYKSDTVYGDINGGADDAKRSDARGSEEAMCSGTESKTADELSCSEAEDSITEKMPCLSRNTSP